MSFRVDDLVAEARTSYREVLELIYREDYYDAAGKV